MTALLLALSASACSGGAGQPADAAAGAEPGLAACGRVFGAGNVEALRTDLGEAFRPHDRSLAEMKERMLAEARAWNPETDKLSRTTFRPCQIEGRAGGEEAWVNATAGWSTYGVAFMTEGKHARDFREVAKGVYLDRREGLDGHPLVMACTVPGTRAGQGAELPLQVSVADKDRTDRSVSTERLLKSLAESTRALLGCAEKPPIPDDLLP